MSGSINLFITTEADWAVQMQWLDAQGEPVIFTQPTMDIRQELSPTGNLVARLDSSGNLDGKIEVTAPGTLVASIPKDRTNTLQTGIAFWDIFVYVNLYRVRFAFGAVSVGAHVTALT